MTNPNINLHFLDRLLPPTKSRTMSLSRIALIPRTLALSAQEAVTQPHIIALYKQHLQVANSFPSYNFREYFIRRTRENFRSTLPSLASPLAATKSIGTKTSAPVEAGESESIYAPKGVATTATNESGPTGVSLLTPEEVQLKQWYSNSLDDLAILTRSAMVNRLYEGQKLVVESKPKLVEIATEQNP